MGLMKDFKEFISKGNVIDMAVGVIIGGAFTAIVNSLVGDIFTPILNLATGQLNFTEWVIPIGSSQIMIGNFVQAIFVFLVTALCLFLVLRAINRLQQLKKKEEEAKPAAPAAPSKEEVLLTEIRDLLAAKKGE